MTFTDNDLKRLKESIKEHPEWYQERFNDVLSRILARLEAAERIIEGYKSNWDLTNFNKAIETWRKAAGK